MFPNPTSDTWQNERWIFSGGRHPLPDFQETVSSTIRNNTAPGKQNMMRETAEAMNGKKRDSHSLYKYRDK